MENAIVNAMMPSGVIMTVIERSVVILRVVALNGTRVDLQRSENEQVRQE